MSGGAHAIGNGLRSRPGFTNEGPDRFGIDQRCPDCDVVTVNRRNCVQQVVAADCTGTTRAIATC